MTKPKLFPPLEPASLTDPQTIIAHDWAAYRALAELTDHWSRPAWPDGREAHYWLLALGDQDALRGTARRCQAALDATPGFDLVPLDLLHLTLCRVGAVDGITKDQLTLVAKAATATLSEFAPLSLRVGPLAGSVGAVRFTVTPWDRLFDLQAVLVDATNSVTNGSPSHGFRPHISIAYNNRVRPSGPVADLLEDLRSDYLVDVMVKSAELVTLRRQGRAYRWTTLHSVPFAAGL